MFTNNESLTGGDTIEVAFTVIANPEGFYDVAGTGDTTVTFSAARDTESFTISTNDSPSLTSNGTIDITVVRGDQYEPASAAPEQVAIIVPEPVPTVSVNRVGPSFIDEGEEAVFNVTATGTLSQQLPVAVTVQDASNFIDTTATPIPTSVNVASDTNIGVIRLNTIPDAVDEPNGMIMVTLGDSSDNSYALGSSRTARIEVRDNDDATLPDITISQTGTTPVVEGDPLMFALTANPAPANNTIIWVNVRVSETGDFLSYFITSIYCIGWKYWWGIDGTNNC